ncbi:Fasciclin arabinogalactan family protein [Trifolium repens]|nr:Fasciclin arabinogalactan family protein [Trifolium repens]
MENINHYPHFIIIITLIFFTTFTKCSSTTNTTITTTTNNNNNNFTATSIPPMAKQEINNILDALIGTGDTSINKWVSILSMSNPLLSLTLFIPQQTPSHSSPLDPLSFPYHVIPQRLVFADLLLLPRYSRLPTLIPDKTIVVTDNSSGNFTLDDVLLTHPDLYNTPSLAVHGVKTLLDYSLFGNATMTPSNFLPVGETWKSSHSAASSSSAAFMLFLSVICNFLVQELVFFV